MSDNKIRISHDVLEKAELIASEWGLKNARAAVEAVFRKYCDDYLYGRVSQAPETAPLKPAVPAQASAPSPACDALDALDDLLAM
ncbi:MAG: hypothetical protein F6J97_05840 [Leptolyngbya sp. SIO4C1]|nr:hypothetical protein [Leptolyngbya sp. SIO4C1]